LPPRTFVVTISESPQRVVVEDVRNRRRALAPDLGEVGRRIADLLEQSADGPLPPAGERDVSES
jgi:hypothetical protein